MLVVVQRRLEEIVAGDAVLERAVEHRVEGIAGGASRPVDERLGLAPDRRRIVI
jgi:hypothetical protein